MQVWRRARKIQESHHAAEELSAVLGPTLATPTPAPRPARQVASTGTAIGSEVQPSIGGTMHILGQFNEPPCREGPVQGWLDCYSYAFGLVGGSLTCEI